MIALPESSKDFARLSWDEILPFYNDLFYRELTLADAKEWLDDWSSFEDLLAEAREQTYFDYTCDTADPVKEADNLRFQTEIEPNAAEQRVRLSRRLLDVGYSTADLEESLRRFRTTNEIFREESVPLKADVEKLGAEYQKVVGAFTAEWEGEELPLPRLRPFMLDPDRTIRERAWRLHRQPYVAARDQLAHLFDEQYRLRQKLARNSGFDNFRDYMHVEKHRFDYTPEDCYAFHQAVEDKVVPAVARILDRRRKQMGVEILRPWDLGVDQLGRPALRPFASTEEFVERAVNVFEKVDPKLGANFKTMQSEGLLDLQSRKGKAPGGYMTDLPRRKRPLIFMNAAGVADDLITLVHEAGHCFHGFEQFENDLLFCQRWPGMEMAEVGSMAMELLSAPYWSREQGGFYSEEDYRRARIDHLEGILTFFPHCATVDAFQHWIYTDASGGDAAARDASWLALRRRFEPGVDYSGLTAEWVARWYQQLHIFEVPFYYIEYGIAQLGALQVWRNALHDQEEAVAAYRRALGLGATRPLPELYQAAGIKLAFDAGTIGELVDLVEGELDKLRE
ncbi:MAG TPA: M3 family oligoendopeptidase [Candidatus Dormibacteraeota bacterium]|nr:M3 family oligoendopeptidase [Candidatus Dormibacteraeota bacterium]